MWQIFTTVECRISSRLKWYKNYKNRSRLAKVIVKNKMSRFYGSMCIHIFGGSCPITEFCQVQNSLCVQVLHSPIFQRYCMALHQRASAKLCGVVQGMELRNFHRWRHLFGWAPSWWASAHVLVLLRITAVGHWMSTTWCGLSANLECMSEMCCTPLAENTGRQNEAKSRHLRTIA